MLISGFWTGFWNRGVGLHTNNLRADRLENRMGRLPAMAGLLIVREPYLAYRRPRGKRLTRNREFEFGLERTCSPCARAARSLPTAPACFSIHDPKRRLISAAPFRDRVVHHALVNIIEPLFERRFVYDTYANRKGKGTHRALDRCTHYLRRHAYVLPLDVRQFFPSIDHAVLQDTLAAVIGDERVMEAKP